MARKNTGTARNTGAKLVLVGQKELAAILKKLPARVVRKGLKMAMTAMLAPIVRAAKSRAPRESGLLKKSMAKKVKAYPSGVVAGLVGANRAAEGTYGGKRRVPANYIHLVEQGTAPHQVSDGKEDLVRDATGRFVLRRLTGAAVNHPGARARRFLERAYRETREESIGIARKKLAAVVEKEAAKLAAKGDGRKSK